MDGLSKSIMTAPVCTDDVAGGEKSNTDTACEILKLLDVQKMSLNIACPKDGF
jgi:hypothetical protein